MEIPISQFIEMFGLPENNAHRFDVGVIGDVVKDVHYGTAKKAIDKGKYIYLRMNNITYDGELDLSDIKRIDVPDKDLPGCMVQRGDVLFNRTNSKDLVGKTCCFSDDEPMIIAGYIIRLRMNGKVLPEYLSVFMNLERSKKMLYSMAKGAVGQANINAKEVQSIEIVIPPMDIQNSFLTLSRQSDKSKFACLKSQFIEMFGDPVENPKDFDKCPLMSLAKKITDGVHKKPVYTKTGKPFISVTNINRGVIDFTDCKFVSEEAYQTMIKTTYPERGDVLYTKVGATYGIPAYVDTDEQFGLYVSVCLIKPKHDLIDARFLTESMRMEYIKKQADDRIKGIGVPDLHLQEIKSFEVLCPPRELQEQFVAFVQQSDKSK